VKDVISPERLVIGDGLNVRLLGIKEKPELSSQAIQFIRDKTRGQKIFIKFDAVKHDRDNNLLCYLYLQNKTFINAHLIKQGLVDVDTTLEYKFKRKFLSTAERINGKGMDSRQGKQEPQVQEGSSLELCDESLGTQ